MADGRGERMDDVRGKVAVVTGGAAGIGRGIVEALLEEGARVVIADIEAPVLERTVAELQGRGEVRGVVTDVSDPRSVDALADTVFDTYGACHVLWNNAGVTSGGGGDPWDQEPNDWRWCFGVNVFGSAHGVLAFVPRMIASDEPGVVVMTSSGDGGIAPVPYASVYASSKAAVSCFAEALAHQFAARKTKLRACVFYPSGGLLETGLWEAQRNRPAELARTRPRPPAPGTTFAEFKAALAAAGRPTDTVDLTELGRFAVAGVKAGRFVVSHNLDAAGRLLHARADAIARGELPPSALESLA
jgi:NAD(P)-dependent dehydrogenase (short-subunit alcohol dehydrogenase family)